MIEFIQNARVHVGKTPLKKNLVPCSLCYFLTVCYIPGGSLPLCTCILVFITSKGYVGIQSIIPASPPAIALIKYFFLVESCSLIRFLVRVSYVQKYIPQHGTSRITVTHHPCYNPVIPLVFTIDLIARL
ncbi:unnamed protein product [Moneuplotes crassus]|uniref:Uncharacterized protein n=1 Tax=Euplotes crassus TaxID=5936 RepID=A0AAD1XCD7_EUPCR|nr:unnamed protein product [Moneuplotes crassus]